MPQLDDLERDFVVEAALHRQGIVDTTFVLTLQEELRSRRGSVSPLYLDTMIQILSNMSMEHAIAECPVLPEELTGPDGLCSPIFDVLDSEYGVHSVQIVMTALCRFGGATEYEIVEMAKEICPQRGLPDVPRDTVQSLLEGINQFMPWVCSKDAPTRRNRRFTICNPFREDIVQRYVRFPVGETDRLRALASQEVDHTLWDLDQAWASVPTAGFGLGSPLQRRITETASPRKPRKTKTTSWAPDKRQPWHPTPNRGFYFGSSSRSTWQRDADWKVFIDREKTHQHRYKPPFVSAWHGHSP
mmetsp:Transcript_2239/g.3600  ORF Transcript_2239/g.3600 Transcript_2239/m.3600 type:complete len:301 (-) Transcript_2239:331-1233(-)